MHLTKHHGLGNDFLVALLPAVPDDGAELARRWCHRTRGIGADGLIFGTPAAAADVDLTMTLFNADGSLAEISGNGIRCLAQAEFERRGVGGSINVVAGGGVRTLTAVGAPGPHMQIEVSMGPVQPGPTAPDLATLARPGLELTRGATADVGNPHVVLEVADLATVDIAADGPRIEAHWLPVGINVHFLAQTGDDEITLVHWERGAGVTEACGTGATVAATIAHRWGLVGERVRVLMPGGSAEVSVADDAMLAGPAVRIAAIDIDDDRPSMSAAPAGSNAAGSA